jgi:hypothetical protein
MRTQGNRFDRQRRRQNKVYDARKEEKFKITMTYVPNWTWSVEAEFLAPIQEVQDSILIPQAGNLKSFS